MERQDTNTEPKTNYESICKEFDIELNGYESWQSENWSNEHGKTLRVMVDQKDTIRSVKFSGCMLDSLPTPLKKFANQLKAIHIEDTLFYGDVISKDPKLNHQCLSFAAIDAAESKCCRDMVNNDLAFLFELPSIEYLKLHGGLSAINSHHVVPKEMMNRKCLLAKPSLLINCPMFSSSLKFLKLFDLSGNNLRTLPASINGLKHLEHLNLSKCGLMGYPEILNELVSLKHLDISCNPDLSTISRNIDNLSLLEYLDVSKCNLTEVPPISNLTSLSYLNMDSNEIGIFPEYLQNLRQLQYLIICKCGLRHCPEYLSSYTHLKYLDISRNEHIQKLPDALKQLRELKHIKASNCGLAEFPNVLFSMQHLISADIKENNISVLSKHDVEKLVAQMSSGKISLSLGQLTCPPKRVLEQGVDACFNYLETLTTFNASGLDLSSFPDLSGMESLKKINLSRNPEITSVHPSLANIKSVEYLDLSECGLNQWPEVLCELQNLKDLDISKNRELGWVSPSVSKLKSLELVDLSGCNLTICPDSLGELKSLKSLHLRSNKGITTLPMAIVQLTCLEYLDASRCDLKGCPEFLADIHSLKYLNLSRNARITKIPESLIQHKQIKDFNLSWCSVENFPSALCKRSCPMRVNLEGNPIEEVPECCITYWNKQSNFFTEDVFGEIIVMLTHDNLQQPPAPVFKKGPQACKDYFIELNIAMAIKSSIQCVHILGELGAGKSSLIHSIKEGKSILIPPEDRTIVVDTVRIQRDNVMFNINDFGGHEIYELTCPLFLRRDNQLVLIAVDLAEYCEARHDDLVTKWIATSLAHLRSGTIAVVATKQDLCQEQVQIKCQEMKMKILAWIKKEKEFIQKLKQSNNNAEQVLEMLATQEFPIFVTSAKSGFGLDKVANFLQENTSKTMVLPGSWVNMYKKLSRRKPGTEHGQNYLSLMESQELFRKSLPLSSFYENTRKGLHRCLQFLHDIGVILWYSKNEQLKGVVFHEPGFLIESLRLLFHHNLPDNIKFGEKQSKHIQLKTDFDLQMTNFTASGILTRPLLKCLWAERELDEEIYEKMEELLQMLDLCYKESIQLGSGDQETRLFLFFFSVF